MRDHPAYHITKRTVGYLIRGITLLFAVSIVAFALIKLSPIDPVQQYTTGMTGITEEQREAIALASMKPPLPNILAGWAMPFTVTWENPPFIGGR